MVKVPDVGAIRLRTRKRPSAPRDGATFGQTLWPWIDLGAAPAKLWFIVERVSRRSPSGPENRQCRFFLLDTRPPERRRSPQTSGARAGLGVTMHNGAPNGCPATAADQRAARIAVYVPSTPTMTGITVSDISSASPLNGEATYCSASSTASASDRLVSIRWPSAEPPSCSANPQQSGASHRGRPAPVVNSRCVSKRDGASEFYYRRTCLSASSRPALPGIAPSAVRITDIPLLSEMAHVAALRRRQGTFSVCTDRHRERPPFPR